MSWGDLASLGTAFGTLVLAVATFLSVRSANRAARTAERALQKGLRPILMPSLYTEPVQKIHFIDDHWLTVPGGRAALDLTPDAAYLALSVRNVGSGPAVIDAWDVHAERTQEHRPVEGYHFLGRDLYVAAGSSGYVQVAVRDPTSPAYATLATAVREHATVAVDVLYSDIDETQHHIVRLALNRPPGTGDADGQVWAVNEARHWHLDGPIPDRHA